MLPMTPWLVLLLLGAVPAAADTLTVTVPVARPLVWQDAEGFSHVHIPGFVAIGRPGQPQLPAGLLQVLIPPGQQVDSLELVTADMVDLGDGHVVYPKQQPWPFSWGPRPFTEPDPAVYTGTRTYPPALLERQPLEHFRGFAILPVVLRPVVYNPGPGRLAYLPAVTLVVHTSAARAGAGPGTLYRGYRRDFQALGRLVANPEAMASYRSRPAASRDNNRYVVITSQQLAGCSGPDNLQSLLDDKAGRGLNPLLKTMEEIRTQYTGADDAAKVRAFITDMYLNHGTDYVLLVGDADLQVVGGETQAPVVPVRGLCCYLVGLGTEDNIPSDLYYAALDGDFNADGDSCWGEQEDGTDLLPEVWVGRAPADGCGEVGNFVRKTLDYQNAAGDWLRNVYMVGEWLWDNNGDHEFGIDFLTDVQNSSTADGYDTKGFSESSFYQVAVLDDKFMSGPNCPGQLSPCWSQADILAVLNGGNHIINHLGHSYTDYNMRLYCNDLPGGLTNTLPFFDYSQGCYPAAFDNRTDSSYGYAVLEQDSFVEYLLLGDHGAFAAVMNTRYGLGWYSNYFHRFFWDAAFRQGLNQLGPMQAYAQEQMAPGVWSDSGIQWAFYVSNLFGDPEAALHGILPQQGPYLTYFDHEITTDGSTPAPAGPGRHLVMPIILRNLGADTASGIAATLSSNSPLVTITQANPVFSDIAAGANGRSGLHAEFDIASQAQDGEQLDFTLDWTDAGGYSGEVHFAVRVQQARLVYVSHAVDDSAAGCDGDGIADADETAVFTVTIANRGGGPASNVQAGLAASGCTVSPPVNLGDLAAGEETSAVFTVTPASSLDCPALDWPFSLTLEADELPQPDSDGFTETLNADLVQANFFDDMEGTPPNGWSHSAGSGSDDWGYATTSFHSPSHSWFTADVEGQSDKYLLTPQLNIAGTTQLSFWQRLDSEAGYDGGVIEISVNGGPFEDLGPYITANGYNDTISSWTDSALAGRSAWTGTIAWQQVTVDLSSYAPAEVVVRFRFASDSTVHVTGWWIDDVLVDARQPVCQQQSCNPPPVADAGPDQDVESGALVQLDGSQSYSPGGLPLQYSWSQSSGPAVTLSDSHASAPTFTAPPVSGSAALVFSLLVSDGGQDASDSVTVTVWNCDDGEDCTGDSFTGSGCEHLAFDDCTLCGQDGVCLNG
ncbi:MAG: hypothetical protein DRI34_02130, partial [Deltaproteobacteria bacterium]